MSARARFERARLPRYQVPQNQPGLKLLRAIAKRTFPQPGRSIFPYNFQHEIGFLKD